MVPKTCSIPECEKNLLARGWCAMHYWRWQNYGSPDVEPPSRATAKGPCAASECEKVAHTAGYCIAHYKRLRRYGDPDGGGRARDRREVQERFEDNHSEQAGGCWEWSGEINPDGYGHMRHKGTIPAHRYSFGRANGIEDLGTFGEIDHQCRNRACVNPQHLREVTRSQNAQNQATVRSSKSGYRGVAWHAHSKSWHVVVKLSDRQHSGGYFKDVHEAGRAAIELRNKLYTHNEEDRKLAS